MVTKNLDFVGKLAAATRRRVPPMTFRLVAPLIVVSASLAKGTYQVEVRAKLKAGEKQYSEDNDSVTAGTVHIK